MHALCVIFPRAFQALENKQEEDLVQELLEENAKQLWDPIDEI